MTMCYAPSQFLVHCCAASHDYRGFMSKAWFSNRNAGALRGFLRSIILGEFIDQVRSHNTKTAELKAQNRRLAALRHIRRVR